jgi:cell division septation protein DedD
MNYKDRGSLDGRLRSAEGTPGEHPEVPPETEYPMTVRAAGRSSTRLLLLLLLLVSAGAAYYFLMMGEAEVPPPAPPKATVKAPAPAAPAPPPAAATPDPAPAPADKPAPAAAPPVVAAETGTSAAPASLPNAVSIAPPPRPEAPVAVAPDPSSAATPTQPPAAVVPPPAPLAAQAAPPAAVPAGAWLVEAGSYLDEAVLKSVIKKLRALGYEPQVSTTRTEVAMTRLRLWDVPAADVHEALAYARGIAPDAFALRSGEFFTIYAGTFTNPRNLDQMTERLTSEGVMVEAEPVLVSRSLSRVRIGGLADQATAAEVAAKVRQAGIAAEVVAPR